MGMLSRRQVLKGMALGVAAGALRTVPVRAASLASALHAQFARIESQTGGRLGVAMLDTHNRIAAGYRANQRFPVCSTWKLLAVAALLRQVDEGHENLDRRIRFRASELVVYSPVTKDRVDATGMSLRELCAAALVWSDNSAGNLLLAALGGPSAITRFARAIGDPVTRLDRTEPALNEATPGDARDTTSPRAMLGDLDTLLLGNALTPPSRARLNAWLAASQTGARL
ncbi:CTX-M-90 extended-spectrum beta-lactamase, partial [mine drainage metagenome]